MKSAVAARSFQRSDLKIRVRAGERIIGPSDYIDELAALNLVREVQHHKAAPENKGDPSKAVGAIVKSSALPAAPASQQTIAVRSKRGGKRRQTGESSL